MFVLCPTLEINGIDQNHYSEGIQDVRWNQVFDFLVGLIDDPGVDDLTSCFTVSEVQLLQGGLVVLPSVG